MIPAFIAAVAFIGGVASNLVASDIQEAVKPYRRWVWVTSAVALVVVIIAAIRGESSLKSDEASSTSATAQGAVAAGAISNSVVLTGNENLGIHHSPVQGPVQLVGRQEINNYYHSGPPPLTSPDQLQLQPSSQEVNRSDAVHEERRQIFSLPFPRNEFFTGRDDILLIVD